MAAAADEFQLRRALSVVSLFSIAWIRHHPNFASAGNFIFAGPTPTQPSCKLSNPLRHVSIER
jgi:hypothetical protein